MHKLRTCWPTADEMFGGALVSCIIYSAQGVPHLQHGPNYVAGSAFRAFGSGGWNFGLAVSFECLGPGLPEVTDGSREQAHAIYFVHYNCSPLACLPPACPPPAFLLCAIPDIIRSRSYAQTSWSRPGEWAVVSPGPRGRHSTEAAPGRHFGLRPR